MPAVPLTAGKVTDLPAGAGAGCDGLMINQQLFAPHGPSSQGQRGTALINYYKTVHLLLRRPLTGRRGH